MTVILKYLKTKNLVVQAILILMLFNSCNSQKTENELIVDKLLTYSFDIPPSPELSFIPIYIRQSDSIIYATTYDLKQFYDSKNFSQETTFRDFILTSFNQETNIKDTSLFLNTFHLDTIIYSEYQNHGFDFIVEKYVEKRDDEFDLDFSKAGFGEESTVSYIFFINNYSTHFDCIDGETTYISFRKILNMTE